MTRSKKHLPMPPKDRDADPDASDLFALLLEQSVPSTPQGWFSVPWRNGFHAVWLAYHLDLDLRSDGRELRKSVFDCLIGAENSARVETPKYYWSARKLIRALTQNMVFPEALISALRMMQLYVSSSDGGGHGYNEHLLSLCEKLLERGHTEETLARSVRQARAVDVVGAATSSEQQRRLAAFYTAWDRGLYKLAYCV
jgi:hypothetical protein